MRIPPIIFATGLVAFAACTPDTTPGLVPPIADLPSDDACGAPALQYLVGKPVSAFEGMQHGGPVRVIRSGQPVTMDYSPTRLNVVLDSKDRISRINCG
jgi:hypothetical protein